MADDKIFKSILPSKCCSKCGQNKPRSEFNKEHGRERAYCKECHKAASADWNSKNRDKRRAYARGWAARNKDKQREYRRRHRPSEAALARRSAYKKRRHLERKYGITETQWQEMFDRQGGVCALCRIPGRVGKHGKLAVDHCHDTGRVRGLLCAACNISLGNLGDNEAGLARALSYVRGVAWRGELIAV